MAEAVLVMIVLGLVVAIAITTLKPNEFKEKALAAKADKIMAEIDTATQKILLYDSKNGTMDELIATDGTHFASGYKGNAAAVAGALKIGALYKKYLATTRKKCEDDTCPCWSHTIYKNLFSFFYMENGACIGVNFEESGTSIWYVFPGEDYEKTQNIPALNKKGLLYFDINGNALPNQMGKDQFKIPLGKYGILYPTTDAE